MTPVRTRLDGLQAGRAVAAVMVVLYHLTVYFLPEHYYGGEKVGPGLFKMGYAGVEFFFVLSGFIMVFVHLRDFGVPERAPRFLEKRIVRIYPIYWVIYGLLTLAYFAVPSAGPENARDPIAILTSALLWPMPELPVLGVAWSLQYEMLFYLVFTLLVLNLRFGAVVFVLWTLACVWASLARFESYPFNFLLSFYNPLFAFGILAALCFRRLDLPSARWVLLIGAVAFFGVGISEQLALVDWSKAVRTWCYGIGACLAVMGLAAGAIQPPRWLSFLGDASYSIYLVHIPAISFAGIVLVKLGAPWGLPPLGMMAVMTIYAVAAGAIVHLFVEKPLFSMLSRRRAPVPGGA